MPTNDSPGGAVHYRTVASNPEFAPGHVARYAHTGAAFPPERDCPIPSIHRRLEDAHRRWHETAEAYSAPETFRGNLNALVKTLRGCIWMLQKRTRDLLDFDTWRQGWHEAITGEEVLSWIVRSAAHPVGADELAAASSAKVRLMLASTMPPVAEFSVPAEMATREIALSLVGLDLPAEARNPNFLLVERRWGLPRLPDWDVLEAAAYGYAVLVFLLHDAHHGPAEVVSQGSHISRRRPNRERGILPCMQVTAATRSVLLNLKTGRLQGPHSQWIERDREAGEMVAARFGGVQHLHNALTHEDNDPLYFTAKYFEDAKRALANDKALPQTIRLYTQPGGWRELVSIPASQQDKYSEWQHIAAEVRRAKAEAILMVAEVPLPSRAEPSRLLRAEPPPRREALIMVVETADGRHRTLTAPFRRQGDRIRFGRTHVETDGRRWDQLESVRSVWRTTAPEGSRN